MTSGDFSDPEINVHDACADFIATSKHFEKNLYSYFNVLIILVYPEKYIPKWRWKRNRRFLL